MSDRWMIGQFASPALAIREEFLSHICRLMPLPGVNTTTVPETEINDATVVEACLDGDTAAFATLVRRHQNLVTGVAYSVIGRRAPAEEIAQETFVTAWRQLATLKDLSRTRAWLAGIARNLALNRVRAQQRSLIDGSDGLDQHASAEPSPDHEAMQREEEAVVDHTLAKLPEEYREVLILYYREEQSTANVAEALSLSEDAVRQRLVRGRRLLQERVLHQVERTLQRTAPGAAFAIAVLAFLPAPPAAAASFSAGIAAIPVVSGMVVGTAIASLSARFGLLGAAVGFLLGALGSYWGVKHAFTKAANQAQRRTLVVGTWQIAILAIGYVGAMFACTFNFRALSALHPALGFGGVTLLTICYVIVLVILIQHSNERYRAAAPAEKSPCAPDGDPARKSQSG
jgi:zinc protease